MEDEGASDGHCSFDRGASEIQNSEDDFGDGKTNEESGSQPPCGTQLTDDDEPASLRDRDDSSSEAMYTILEEGERGKYQLECKPPKLKRILYYGEVADERPSLEWERDPKHPFCANEKDPHCVVEHHIPTRQRAEPAMPEYENFIEKTLPPDIRFSKLLPNDV